MRLGAHHAPVSHTAPDRLDVAARGLPGPLLALRTVCTRAEGKTYASRQGLLLWLFPQEVAEKKRHGKALPPCDRR
jgi:hypothetical protein